MLGWGDGMGAHVEKVSFMTSKNEGSLLLGISVSILGQVCLFKFWHAFLFL